MKRIIALLPLPIALLLRWFASGHHNWVEQYFSNGIYPKLAAIISRIMAICPVPVIEIAAVLFFICMLYLLFKKRFFRILSLCCLMAALFLGGWSLNYYRLPLEETLSLTVRPSTSDELAALCESLVDDANARHTMPTANALSFVSAALDAAAKSWPIPKGGFANPKTALCSPLLSRLLTEGITSPFTAEALVNGSIPAISLPYVACHEAAHVRGFAREEDANLIAYLACEASDDPYFRYSGAVSALMSCLNALSTVDYEAYLDCRARISQPVIDDINAHAAYWAAYRETKTAEVSYIVNDTYLQTFSAGDQSARSYGRVVDLLLALEREKDV